MREIKFRAWDKTYNIWHTSWASLFPWGTNPQDTTKIILDIMPNHFEFNQFTGLKDKNGKEIYEGDIIQNKQEKSEVYWVNSGWYPLSMPYFNNLMWTIIGNKYENPELWK